MVGGGAAGLYVALVAARAGATVTVVSRKPLSESASFRAQGGLAAALAKDDSPELHLEDTLKAGRGACRPSAVEVLVREAPGAVEELRGLGVNFDTDPDGILALGLEGGHSARRIVHAGGSETGRAITSRLASLVEDEERIEVLEGASAVALTSDGERCAGVITEEAEDEASGERPDAKAIVARATVLATGGGAALWSRTTNPWGAIGAGIVLAQLAGADVADLELCQFHPTALAKPEDRHDGALLTEAIRGEGATLIDATGRRFVDELAPRDEVTVAILERMRANDSACVWLDMRGVDPSRFPNVVETLAAAGIDATGELVPVAPAAHYLMGGVASDLDGRTSVPGLYAVGECACTGLHGANRLASNSLSECFVFGARAAAAAVAEPAREISSGDPGWRFEPPTAETREAVWSCAGPRRETAGLERLLEDPYPLARMIAAGALARAESRGAHRIDEFPRPNPDLDGIHFVHRAAQGVEAERWA